MLIGDHLVTSLFICKCSRRWMVRVLGEGPLELRISSELLTVYSIRFYSESSSTYIVILECSKCQSTLSISYLTVRYTKHQDMGQRLSQALCLKLKLPRAHTLTAIDKCVPCARMSTYNDSLLKWTFEKRKTVGKVNSNWSQWSQCLLFIFTICIGSKMASQTDHHAQMAKWHTS